MGFNRMSGLYNINIETKIYVRDQDIQYVFIHVYFLHTYTYVQSRPLCDFIYITAPLYPRHWNHVQKLHKKLQKSRKPCMCAVPLPTPYTLYNRAIKKSDRRGGGYRVRSPFAEFASSVPVDPRKLLHCREY